MILPISLAGKRSLIFLFLLACLPALTQNKDSLRALWNDTSRPDSIRLRAVDHLCSIHSQNSKADSAILLADLQYALAKKVGREKDAIRAMTRKAGAYSIKDDDVKAHAIYQLALKLSRKEHYDIGVIVCSNNLGTIYLSWGDYAKAIHFFYEALRGVEKKGNPVFKSAALCNIAEIYTKIGRHDSAFSILRQALHISQGQPDRNSLASTLRIISDTYLDVKNLDSALHYQLKVMTMRQELNDFRIRHTYFDLSTIYFAKGDYRTAESYINKSQQLSETLPDSVLTGKCIAQRSYIHHAEGHLDKALSELNKAYAMLKGRYDPRLKLELLGHLVTWEKEKGNYKTALELNEQYTHLNDSLNLLNGKSALYLEQLKYDSEKKDLLAKASTEKKLAGIRAQAEEKDLKKNIWLLIFSFLLLLLILIAFFIYYRFKQRTIIAVQKSDLLKQQLLVSQMNPHFIFNSLNAIQNFIYKQDSAQAGLYLKQFSELIRNILDFSRKDLISLDEEVTFLQSYLNLQKLRFGNKFNYELVIDPALDTELVLVPPMLAQPFIENAIEHGIFYKDGAGFLSLRISQQGASLLYEIEDNGIGLEAALKLKKNITGQHRSLAIDITRERIGVMNRGKQADPGIEIRDKVLYDQAASGVHVKFAIPFLIS